MNPSATVGLVPPSPGSPSQPFNSLSLYERYKTKACCTYTLQGSCRYGTRCMYAHGDHDMRTVERNIADGLTTDDAIRAHQNVLRMRAQTTLRAEERIAHANGLTRLRESPKAVEVPPMAASVSTLPLAGSVAEPLTPAAGGTSSESPAPILAQRFKTKPCRTWGDTGTCPYQERCMFAHGDADRRTKEENVRDGLTTEAAIKSFQQVQMRRNRRDFAASKGILRGSSATGSPAMNSAHTLETVHASPAAVSISTPGGGSTRNQRSRRKLRTAYDPVVSDPVLASVNRLIDDHEAKDRFDDDDDDDDVQSHISDMPGTYDRVERGLVSDGTDFVPSTTNNFISSESPLMAFGPVGGGGIALGHGSLWGDFQGTPFESPILTAIGPNPPRSSERAIGSHTPKAYQQSSGGQTSQSSEALKSGG
jgi:hypothetical protein